MARERLPAKEFIICDVCRGTNRGSSSGITMYAITVNSYKGEASTLPYSSALIDLCETCFKIYIQLDRLRFL